MHFLSPLFLVIFLPIALFVWIVLTRRGLNSIALIFLTLASACFYLGDRPVALFLVITSALVNYGLASLIRSVTGKLRQNLVFLGVIANIIFLGYFKYLTFLTGLTLLVFEIRVPLDQPEFPIGISFYTITQIAYLCSQGRPAIDKQRLIDYLCFVLYFPKILAGPVMYANEFFNQTKSEWSGHKTRLEDISIGLSLFCIGACKKIGFAEPLAQIANMMFSVNDEFVYTTSAAWIGILAYTLQLYFDFSGYSDMAIGISRMFGIKLPQNFNSPLSAKSLLGFWQGWHMTMTRLFIQFVYNPISMALTRREFSLKSKKLRLFFVTVAIPTLITFSVSGIWHGSTLNFLCFGLINGIGLTINHAWRSARLPKLPNPIGWALMLITVMISLVFVRAPNMESAISYLQKLLEFPYFTGVYFGPTENLFGTFLQVPPQISTLSLCHLVLSLGIVTFMPNSQWIMRKYDPTLSYISKPSGVGFLSKITWCPNFLWALISVLSLAIALFNLSNKPFVYFAF